MELPLVELSHRNGLKVQKKYKQISKTLIILVNKIISCYVNNMFLCFIFHLNYFHKNYTKSFNMFIWATFENHWDIFFREFSRKKTKRNEYIDHSQNNYKNAYCPNNRKTFKT